MRSSYSIQVGKPEGKRLLGRPRHKWEDNTRMNLKEINWESVVWTHFAQGLWAVVNMVMNLWVS
jgi:hypothetical protein